jgi:hypothetical protein
MCPPWMARAGWDGVPGHVDAPVGSLMTGGGFCVFFRGRLTQPGGRSRCPRSCSQGKGVSRGGQGGKNVGTAGGGDAHGQGAWKAAAGAEITEAGRPRSEEALPPGRGGTHMAHHHGNEYQVRIVHEDGTEELSGWMQSEEQVAPAMVAIHRPQGTAYWLRARNVLCPDCLERGLRIWKYPLTGIPSSRYRPHDSEYLLAARWRNRAEVPQPRRINFARDTMSLYSMVLEIVVSSQRAA